MCQTLPNHTTTTLEMPGTKEVKITPPVPSITITISFLQPYSFTSMHIALAFILPNPQELPCHSLKPHISLFSFLYLLNINLAKHGGQNELVQRKMFLSFYHCIADRRLLTRLNDYEESIQLVTPFGEPCACYAFSRQHHVLGPYASTMYQLACHHRKQEATLSSKENLYSSSRLARYTKC